MIDDDESLGMVEDMLTQKFFAVLEPLSKSKH